MAAHIKDAKVDSGQPKHIIHIPGINPGEPAKQTTHVVSGVSSEGSQPSLSRRSSLVLTVRTLSSLQEKNSEQLKDPESSDNDSEDYVNPDDDTVSHICSKNSEKATPISGGDESAGQKPIPKSTSQSDITGGIIGSGLFVKTDSTSKKSSSLRLADSPSWVRAKKVSAAGGGFTSSASRKSSDQIVGPKRGIKHAIIEPRPRKKVCCLSF